MSEIVSSERAVLFVKRYDWSDGQYEPGLNLRMTNGSLWFHPFNGQPPKQIKPPRMANA